MGDINTGQGPQQRRVRRVCEVTWRLEAADTGAPLAVGCADSEAEALRETTWRALSHARYRPVRWWVKQGGKTIISGSLQGVTITETTNDGAMRPRPKRAGLRGPMPVRCEICQWRGRRLTPRRAPCPACGSRVEFA